MYEVASMRRNTAVNDATYLGQTVRFQEAGVEGNGKVDRPSASIGNHAGCRVVGIAEWVGW